MAKEVACGAGPVLLLCSLHGFFGDKANFDVLADVKVHRRLMCLRKLEYFVTKMSGPALIPPGQEQDVHTLYKNTLRAFNKEKFAPFCRKDPGGRRHRPGMVRFDFETPHGVVPDTSVAQLNFIRWTIESGVLKMAIRFKDVIAAAMAATLQARKSAAAEGGSVADDAVPASKKERRRPRKRKLPMELGRVVVKRVPLSVSAGDE